MLVYLAGPITGITYSAATDWRSEFGLVCPPNIITLSPMRGKEYLKSSEGVMPNAVLAEPGSKKFMSTPRAIYSRDVFDVRRADALVVNFLGSTEKSLGTIFEIGYARALGKIVIVVMEPGNVHDHVFIRESANFIVPSLRDAEDLLIQMA